MFVANLIRKTWGHKNGDISGTVGQNDLIFWHNLPWGCPNYRWHQYIGISTTAPLQYHQHQHIHSGDTFGKQRGYSLTVIQTTWYSLCIPHALPTFTCTPLWLPWMSSHSLASICEKKNSFLRSLSSLLNHCHHDVLWNVLRCGLFHNYFLLHSNMLLFHCKSASCLIWWYNFARTGNSWFTNWPM